MSLQGKDIDFIDMKCWPHVTLILQFCVIAHVLHCNILFRITINRGFAELGIVIFLYQNI